MHCIVVLLTGSELGGLGMGGQVATVLGWDSYEKHMSYEKQLSLSFAKSSEVSQARAAGAFGCLPMAVYQLDETI